jgi:hypothetical protein
MWEAQEDEITIDNGSISISQQIYIENLLQREGMADENPVEMPLDTQIKLAPNPQNNNPNCSNSYPETTGGITICCK